MRDVERKCQLEVEREQRWAGRPVTVSASPGIPHGGMGIARPAAVPGLARTHRCNRSCVPEPDRYRLDVRSSLGS